MCSVHSCNDEHVCHSIYSVVRFTGLHSAHIWSGRWVWKSLQSGSTDFSNQGTQCNILLWGGGTGWSEHGVIAHTCQVGFALLVWMMGSMECWNLTHETPRNRADYHYDDDDDEVDQQRLHSSLPGHFPWWDRGSGKRDENHRSSRVTTDWAGHDITTRHRIRNCDSRKDKWWLQCLVISHHNSQDQGGGGGKKTIDNLSLLSLATWTATMSWHDVTTGHNLVKSCVIIVQTFHACLCSGTMLWMYQKIGRHTHKPHIGWKENRAQCLKRFATMCSCALCSAFAMHTSPCKQAASAPCGEGSTGSQQNAADAPCCDKCTDNILLQPDFPVLEPSQLLSFFFS